MWRPARCNSQFGKLIGVKAPVFFPSLLEQPNVLLLITANDTVDRRVTAFAPFKRFYIFGEIRLLKLLVAADSVLMSLVAFS